MSSPSDSVIMDKPNHQHNDLSRQVTMSLSADQYERLFFQPSAAKGDLAKRLGMIRPYSPYSLSDLSLLTSIRKPHPPRRPRLPHPFLQHSLLPPPIPRLLHRIPHLSLRNLLLPRRNRHEHRWDIRVHPRKHLPHGRLHNLRFSLGKSSLSF